MPSKITIKRSTTAAAPAGLSFGEMAFVQGSGLTANQLYMGISGGSPVWVGAQIGTTGTWTDDAAKTSLATQYATDQRISSLITATAVSSVNGATGDVVNVAITTNSLSQFAATTSVQLLGVISDETGTGSLVFATSPTLVTPALGTPSALVGTNITGTATAFTASNVTTNANLTGHITSTGNAAVLGSFTSGQLATALTDETGSGSAVFATNPTLVTPTLGTPASGTLTNCTFPTLNQNTTGSAATLTTSRNINGTGFNGSADITVTAAANTLTGATLASNVLASSLTSVGTLASLSITGDLTVGGTFTVNGTVTTINSTTLTVDDKNIELGSVTTPSNETADGGGITLKGATDKSIIWDTTNDNWTSSENWNLPTGKVFKINNASVLSSTTLGSAVVASSLTSVGTITSGTWSGSFGAVSGANLTTLTAGNLSGTIPSGVLANSTVYIGTTVVALNRASASLALTGISSIDGSAATVTTAAQPNITSVGTLTSLTVSGTLEAGLIECGTF